MRRFMRRRGEFQSLEDELRQSRPEPRGDFVRLLAGQVHERVHQPRRGFRVALAGSLTVGMLVALASFGGLGYASSAVKPVAGWVKVVQHVVAPAKKGHQKAQKANATRVLSAQYSFTLCHHPDSKTTHGQTITVGSPAAVNAHLSNHPNDHPGACTPAESVK